LKKGIKVFVGVALVATLIALTGCGSAKTTQGNSSTYTKEKPLIVKFSHVVTADSPKGQASIKFAELLAQKTEGKVKVEVFPSSQLYGDKDELEALQAGNVQVIAPSATKLVGFNPVFQIVDLPFLFKDHNAVVNFWDGDLGKKLMNSLESKNIQGLSMWENGFKVFTSRKPISKPEDFKGQKFRTQAGKVLESQFKALDAGAATIPFGETYTALQQGTIDGQENTWNNIDTQKYEEVQKNLLVSNHGRIDYIVLTNKKWYDSLPSDIQKAFRDSMTEATKYERELSLQLDKASEDKLRKSGKIKIIDISKEERDAFSKKMEPVLSEFEKTIGKEYIDGAKKL
jgi:C4-dicarboxylate-binding protein DctP